MGLAIAKAAGWRSVVEAPAPERPEVTPVPECVDPVWLLARLYELRPSGRVQPAGWRRAVLVVQMCEMAARTREKGRQVSGTVRVGTHELAVRLAAIEGKGARPDHTSARRILHLLQDVGAVALTVVEDDQGQARATDVQLLGLCEPSVAALAWARARLTKWTREKNRRWLAPLKLLNARRAAGQAPARAPHSFESAPPPFGGAATRHPEDGTPHNFERLVEQRPSARAHAPARPQSAPPRSKRSADPRIERGTQVLAGPVSPDLAARLLRDAVEVDAGHLPPLVVLRAALAVHLGGADGARWVPLGGLSDKHAERLERDALKWMRWREHATPELRDLTAVGVLMRLASQVAATHDGEPPRDWLTTRERTGATPAPSLLTVLARRFRVVLADASAEHRRHRELHRHDAQSVRWPAWLVLDADGLPTITGPFGRYLAVEVLPSDAELASVETRQALRAAFVARGATAPTHAELRAADGSYAIVPITRRPLARPDDYIHDGRGTGRVWTRRGAWPEQPSRRSKRRRR